MSDQQAYWDNNLDPQNLSGKAPCNLEQELSFARSPEQDEADRLLGDVRGRRVLELGCGLGVNALMLARRGAKVVAIDLAYARLHEAAQLMQKEKTEGEIFLVQASADALPFKDEVFDGAFSKAVLIHTKLESVAPEISRALAEGGAGVFIEPLQRNPFVRLYRHTLAPKIWREIARYFGPEETAALSKQFPELTWRDFHLFGFLAYCFQFGIRAPLLFRLSVKVLSAIDRVLFACCPPLRGLAWMRVFHAQKMARRPDKPSAER